MPVGTNLEGEEWLEAVARRGVARRARAEECEAALDRACAVHVLRLDHHRDAHARALLPATLGPQRHLVDAAARVSRLREPVARVRDDAARRAHGVDRRAVAAAAASGPPSAAADPTVLPAAASVFPAAAAAATDAFFHRAPAL